MPTTGMYGAKRAAHGTLDIGGVDGEQRCGGDRRVGDAFLAKSSGIATSHNRRAQLEALPAGSLERLAFLLGGKRGTRPALSAALAGAFGVTWGVLSRDLRRSA